MASDTCDARSASDGRVADIAADAGVLLFTPAQAAALLQVRESWLRRRAAERRVPCSFVGKHLRFSRDDLDVIVAASARPARASGRARRPRRPPDRSGR
jgi:excisionase family DNA binding protein